MLGLGTSLVKGGKVGRTYVKDGLKLYMPYKGDALTKGTQFVGTGSTYFTTDDNIAINALSLDGGLTISLWLKLDNLVNQPILGNSSDTYWFYIDTATVLNFRVSGAYYSWAPGYTLAINTWYHFAITRPSNDAGNRLMVVYVDGIPYTGSQQSPSGTFYPDRIGYTDHGGAKYYDGNIKNLAIWERALTATEIQNVMYKSYAEVSGRLSSGLVSWWALDSSTNTYDDSTGNNDGTNNGSTLQDDIYGGYTPVIPRGIDNAPTVQADAIGAGSASFDGVDDYIALGISAADSNLTSGTITAWVNADVSPPSANAPIISLQDPANTGDIFLISVRGDEANDPLQVLVKNNGSQTLRSNYDNDTLAAGVWTHIAYTCDSTDGNALYVNGVLATATSGADSSVTAAFLSQVTVRTNGFQIGSLAAETRWHDGNICQVGLWSAALTQVQIQSIMEKTYSELTSTETASLVSYWALDEQTGIDGEAGTGGVKDSHGSNHGTMYDS